MAKLCFPRRWELARLMRLKPPTSDGKKRRLNGVPTRVVYAVDG